MYNTWFMYITKLMIIYTLQCKHYRKHQFDIFINIFNHDNETNIIRNMYIYIYIYCSK